MCVLGELQPKRVFYYFEELCKIPHGSYHTKQISDYCVSVAQKLGFEVRQDKWNNVVIRKPASKGCEQAPVLMLQGHLDMVCEKETGSDHDFETEGLELMIQNGYVTAKDTTLGGDDGIAIAIALAVLEDTSLIHPPLELVFTTEEEVGMEGALGLDTSDLKASYLLNLDSEDEGVLTVSCAGGSTTKLERGYQPETVSGIPYRLSISGLLGGHSGVEIQKGRANSNKLIVRLLADLSKEVNYHLISLNGGKKHNAIPRETVAYIVFESEQEIRRATSVIGRYCGLYQEAYKDSEPDIHIDLQPCGVEYKVKNGHLSVLTSSDAEKLVQILMLLPDSVQSMSQTIPGLPETSLNLGVLETLPDENKVYIEVSNRSSNSAGLKLLEEQIQYIADMCGFHCEIQSAYPGWSYRKDSRLQKVMADIYQDLFQKEVTIEAIHAGLECGILASKMPELDIVSTGPDILDIHTPQERMSIASVQRIYTYVLAVLEALTKETVQG